MGPLFCDILHKFIAIKSANIGDTNCYNYVTVNRNQSKNNQFYDYFHRRISYWQEYFLTPNVMPRRRGDGEAWIWY